MRARWGGGCRIHVKGQVGGGGRIHVKGQGGRIHWDETCGEDSWGVQVGGGVGKNEYMGIERLGEIQG